LLKRALNLIYHLLFSKPVPQNIFEKSKSTGYEKQKVQKMTKRHKIIIGTPFVKIRFEAAFKIPKKKGFDSPNLHKIALQIGGLV
jgi:hypothetical protein